MNQFQLFNEQYVVLFLKFEKQYYLHFFESSGCDFFCAQFQTFQLAFFCSRLYRNFDRVSAASKAPKKAETSESGAQTEPPEEEGSSSGQDADQDLELRLEEKEAALERVSAEAEELREKVSFQSIFCSHFYQNQGNASGARCVKKD